VSDNPVTNVDRIYSVGDPVLAMILKVDSTAKRISLSLKASLFEGSEMENGSDEEGSDEISSIVMEDVNSNSENVVGNNNGIVSEETSDDECMPAINLHTGLNASPLDVDFSWDSKPEATSMPVDSDSSDEEQESKKPKSKRKKRQEKELEYERINKLEEIQGLSLPPETSEQFERSILEAPNNSYLWIKYMAFEAGLAELEKARRIAERAISSISFREEQEKQNIWVAYLNLENTFGSSETLTEVFDRACQYNESKNIHIHLAQIYERSNKPQVLMTNYRWWKLFTRRCARNLINHLKFGLGLRNSL
jgi:rRNA biogenesis protein RRP5